MLRFLEIKIFIHMIFKLVKAISFAIVIYVQVMLAFTLVFFRVKTHQLFLNKSMQLCKRETLF